jgi:peptidoglycan hydrolase CwlO-like protein
MQIKTILSLLLLLGSFSATMAQRNVVETERMMSFGSRPGFRLEFPNASADLIEDRWKEWAKKHYNAKLKKGKGGELVATGVKSSAFGSDEFSLYSKVEKNGNGATLMVWYDLGSSFLNSRDNPSLANETIRSLNQMYYDGRRATIGVELKNEENKLKDLEKKHKNLQSENEKLHKSIEDYKARIRKAEDDIAKNTKDQEITLNEIATQRQVIEDTKKRSANVENEGN